MRLYILLFIIVLIRILTYQSSVVDGQKVRVTGTVNRETVSYEYSQLIEVGGLSAFVDKYPEVSYGDSVVVEGVVQEGMLEDAILIEHKETSSALYKVRNKILSFYQESLPEPHASLISGVVLGSKSGMSDSFWESLKSSGTAHVVVASGMNVTLIGGFVLNTLVNAVDRKKAIIGVLLSVWIYALLAGFDAPIIRAAIMGSIAFSAQILGRLNNAIRALVLSAFVMLILNPLWIRDVGFQLSFMATLSLILFESKVERLIYFVPNIIRQDLSTSLAAQIGVAPLLLYYFKTFNILSPFINAVVLWTIPLMTILGMIAGVVGLFIPTLGKIVLFITYPLSSWFVMIVGLVA